MSRGKKVALILLAILLVILLLVAFVLLPQLGHQEPSGGNGNQNSNVPTVNENVNDNLGVQPSNVESNRNRFLTNTENIPAENAPDANGDESSSEEDNPGIPEGIENISPSSPVYSFAMAEENLEHNLMQNRAQEVARKVLQYDIDSLSDPQWTTKVDDLIDRTAMSSDPDRNLLAEHLNGHWRESMLTYPEAYSRIEDLKVVKTGLSPYAQGEGSQPSATLEVVIVANCAQPNPYSYYWKSCNRYKKTYSVYFTQDYKVYYIQERTSDIMDYDVNHFLSDDDIPNPSEQRRLELEAAKNAGH